MAKVFKQDVMVHFDQADPGKILFFANHFSYAHRLIENFCSNTNIGWDNWFNCKERAVPLIHAEANYKSPIFPGNKYTAELSVISIGRSSVEFQIQFSFKEKLCSQIKTKHIFVTIPGMIPISIPKDIKLVLNEYLIKN